MFVFHIFYLSHFGYYFQDADIEDEAEAFEEDEEIFGSSSQSEKIQQ